MSGRGCLQCRELIADSLQHCWCSPGGAKLRSSGSLAAPNTRVSIPRGVYMQVLDVFEYGYASKFNLSHDPGCGCGGEGGSVDGGGVGGGAGV